MSLRQAVGRWAKRLHRQLLQAALVDDKQRIRQVADELQAPPLLGKAVNDAPDQSEDEGTADEDELGDDDDRDDGTGSCAEDSDSDDDQPRRRGLRVDRHTTFADSDDSSSSGSVTVKL